MVNVRNTNAPRARRRRAALAALVGLLAASPAVAQDSEGEIVAVPISRYGWDLSPTQASALLVEMRQLTVEALATSRQAEQAASVDQVKSAAGAVLQAVWGLPAGLSDRSADVRVHGWKEVWQTTGAEFDPKWVQRYGTQAPTITDPRELGLVGRGRAVRGRLERMVRQDARVPAAQKAAAEQTLASLNNLIGWTQLTTGLKVTEVQPRISLTHLWDAPSEFWQSSADSGWLYEVYAQATNILKTDYAGDVAEARRHAGGMSQLLQKVLSGVDADRSGAVEPKMMEGGLNAALSAAPRAGLRAN